ncbi:EamA family transporter RarD [Amphibacillus sediminis]|uniref:EamA family transporter RarD n=1 Tax=Amphibacillus sediminis TaxID=360185 RepID=UPI00082C5662|nr:EamA family transporter RarD [Amphibacillus sediminis]
MNESQVKLGSLSAAIAYLIWGILPVYWKAVGSITAGALLAHRIVWSFVFMFFLLIISNHFTAFLKECKVIFRNRKKVFGLILASTIISCNWLIFIWAVNSNYVIQASLGYYINPLISILLGVIILKEALSQAEFFSVILAGLGVTFLTFSYGVFPWVSFLLAITFALYALIKKTLDISPMSGLTLETLMVFPFALTYLFIEQTSLQAMGTSLSLAGLLVGAGIVTAIPLLLFAVGAKKIPLSMIGFLQYISPTLMLLIGVFIYNETFTFAHLIAFLAIWIALGIYTSSRFLKLYQSKQAMKKVS